jgi:DNA-binding transcriptional regulator YdaS (Cro superfamily)
MQKLDAGLQRAIEAVGTRYALAKGLGLSPSSVLRWRRIPYKRVKQVEQVTGLDRAELCPDLFSGWEKVD